MPVGGFSEGALVAQPAMRLLSDLGWETLSGYDDHPGAGGPIGRSTFSEAILEARLGPTLQAVNPGSSES